MIVTTNFDRLIENALRERAIEPTIVASVDALRGAEPPARSHCYILKLHGDYKDARILNPEAELSGYPAEYDRLLDRILDEYGLIVCGWSGEWDNALRAAILRAPNRRYAMYWASRSQGGGRAQELVKHRAARVIPITDADSFFQGLQQRVRTLEETHRQNPLSVELLVASTKRFVAKPEHRIQLHDLFAEEVSRLIARLDSPLLSPPSTWDAAIFRQYIGRYEAATEALACMCGILGRWGNGSDNQITQDIVRVLWAQAKKIGGGYTAYLNVRSYPALLTFTAYGLGLTRAGRWASLHELLAAVDGEHEERAVARLFLTAWEGRGDHWQHIDSPEMRRTPLNDHLYVLFSEWRRHFIDIEPDFMLMFERFEMLGALTYLEASDKNRIRQALANQERSRLWMPVGRVGWDSQNGRRLVDELQEGPLHDVVLAAGFARKDPELLDLFIKYFKVIASKMHW